jgi:hypothetical protein
LWDIKKTLPIGSPLIKMIIVNTSQLTPAQKTAALKLWNEEYPFQLQYNSVNGLDSYLSSLSDLCHFLLLENEEVLGWSFKFNRESGKWFVIILSSRIHYKGFGSKLLKMLMEGESELSGWVVDKDCYLKYDLSPYKSPINFYYKNGFKTEEDVRLELPELSAVKITWTKNNGRSN